MHGGSVYLSAELALSVAVWEGGPVILLLFILWLGHYGLTASLFLFAGECVELLVEGWLLYEAVDWWVRRGR